MAASPILASLRRALRWHRRLFAAVFAALAVYCILTVLTTADEETSVVAAARPIPGGNVIGAADLTTLRLPTDAVPEGALTSPDQALGRTVVAPIPGRGVLTASSLASAGNLVAPGRLALPVNLEESAPVSLLRVGDRIDLLGLGGSGTVEVLAQGVRVVAIPTTDAGGLLAARARVLLVDLSHAEAARVVAATAGSPLMFALR